MNTKDSRAFNLEHRDALISEIVEGLKKLEIENAKKDFMSRPDLKLVHVNVQFYRVEDGEKDALWNGSLVAALDSIANDVYWDENGNWGKAEHAEVTYG